MRLFVGVDIGTKGAFCIMDENRNIVDVLVMPLFSKKFGKTKNARTSNYADWKVIEEFLNKYKDTELIFSMEIVRALKSAYGSLNMGISYGIIWKTIDNFGEVHFVSPSDWMPDMLKKYSKAIKMLDIHKTNSKNVQIALAKYVYGDEILLATKRSTVAHDGIADAIWLADFLRRKLRDS